MKFLGGSRRAVSFSNIMARSAALLPLCGVAKKTKPWVQLAIALAGSFVMVTACKSVSR
jgi:hypothetical protein